MREIIDEETRDMLNGMMKHVLEPFKIYNAGEYEKECLVLIAREDCSLYDSLCIRWCGRRMTCRIMGRVIS